MTSFMEQVADPGPWSGQNQSELSAPSEAVPNEVSSSRFGDRPRMRRDALVRRFVEADILPCLAYARARAPGVTAHRAAAAAMKNSAVGVAATDDDTTELVRLLLTRDAASAIGWIESLRQRGATPASLYLGIMTQAACRLGALWDIDRCDFAQVTISMGRLQQVLRALSPHFQAAAVSRPRADTVLLLPTPGEQHTLGLVMLGEFFKREGWHVTGGPGAGDAAALVHRNWIGVVGFSVGSGARLDSLVHAIQAVRRASCNPGLCVIVGGPLLLRQPGLAARVGADAGATDAQQAVRLVRRLFAIRATG